MRSPQEAIYINLSPYLIQQVVEAQSRPELERSLSKQLLRGQLSNQSKEMLLASKKSPRLMEAGGGGGGGHEGRSTRSMDMDSEGLKMFDPFERVLLGGGSIDNPMITSARTVQRQNNLVSPYSYKIIHKNFAPKQLTSASLLPHRLNRILRSRERKP